MIFTSFYNHLRIGGEIDGMQAKEMADCATLEITASSRVVSDYFEICLHNILFQRQIYPKEDFKVVRKFGLNLVYSANEEVIEYIRKIIKQLHRWIFNGKIQWLTMLIVSKETEQISEKWMFRIDLIDEKKEHDNENDSKENTVNKSSTFTTKSISETQKEIQSIIRQISSSITFLPEFEEPQTFKILVHTVGDIKSTQEWDDAKPLKELDGIGIESVEFDNFETNKHNISTFVTYKQRNE